MGTGPGEIWVGPGEIKVAYEYFFEASIKEPIVFADRWQVVGRGDPGGSWGRRLAHLFAKRKGRWLDQSQRAGTRRWLDQRRRGRWLGEPKSRGVAVGSIAGRLVFT